MSNTRQKRDKATSEVLNNVSNNKDEAAIRDKNAFAKKDPYIKLEIMSSDARYQKMLTTVWNKNNVSHQDNCWNLLLDCEKKKFFSDVPPPNFLGLMHKAKIRNKYLKVLNDAILLVKKKYDNAAEYVGILKMWEAGVKKINDRFGHVKSNEDEVSQFKNHKRKLRDIEEGEEVEKAEKAEETEVNQSKPSEVTEIKANQVDGSVVNAPLPRPLTPASTGSIMGLLKSPGNGVSNEGIKKLRVQLPAKASTPQPASSPDVPSQSPYDYRLGMPSPFGALANAEASAQDLKFAEIACNPEAQAEIKAAIKKPTTCNQETQTEWSFPHEMTIHFSSVAAVQPASSVSMRNDAPLLSTHLPPIHDSASASSMRPPISDTNAPLLLPATSSSPSVVSSQDHFQPLLSLRQSHEQPLQQLQQQLQLLQQRQQEQVQLQLQLLQQQQLQQQQQTPQQQFLQMRSALFALFFGNAQNLLLPAGPQNTGISAQLLRK